LLNTTIDNSTKVSLLLSSKETFSFSSFSKGHFREKAVLISFYALFGIKLPKSV